MLLSKRSLLGVLLLAGCGFSPALGTKGAAQKLMGSVRANDPGDQNGFEFVKHVEERLGPPLNAVYALSYTISTASSGVGITADGAITRYNLVGNLDWVLTRNSDRVQMTAGHETTFTSYSATSSTVAGLTAGQDAGRRLVAILADQMISKLMATADTFAP